MRYQIYKVRNGEWKLEWENGRKSTHSTRYGAEAMALQSSLLAEPTTEK